MHSTACPSPPPPVVVNPDIDGDGVLNTIDIDDDNDGLIEITEATMAEQLTMLHNMRYNLAGTSYDDEAADSGTGNDAGTTVGAPTSATANCSTGTNVDGDVNTALTFLCGYELTGNLSFDTGSNGTWSNTSTADVLDSADDASPYFVTADGGWIPIGSANSDGNRFVAVFEGNGHSITGLAVQRDPTYVGMFGVIGAGAEIRNLGLIRGLADYSGRSSRPIYVGGLIGYQNGGSVTASFGFSTAAGGEIAGLAGTAISNSPITSADLLTSAIANNPNDNTVDPDDNKWNSASDITMAAWDFTNRASKGGPRLFYADYDGNRTATTSADEDTILFHCANDASNAPSPSTGKTLILVPNCGMPLPEQGSFTRGALSLTSSSFTNGMAIPVQHHYDSSGTSTTALNENPELTWTNVPEGTVELVLIVHDSLAVAGNFVHWVLADIPPGNFTIPAAQTKDTDGTVAYNGYKLTQLVNSFATSATASAHYERRHFL